VEFDLGQIRRDKKKCMASRFSDLRKFGFAAKRKRMPAAKQSVAENLFLIGARSLAKAMFDARETNIE